jgi:hypothetical protein
MRVDEKVLTLKFDQTKEKRVAISGLSESDRKVVDGIVQRARDEYKRRRLPE